MMTDKWSRVRLAIEHGQIDTMRRYIAEGDDLNEPPGPSGLPLLHHAIDVERDVSIQNDLPLSADMTELLLEGGADPLQTDRRGETALQFARRRGHHLAISAIERLLRDAP